MDSKEWDAMRLHEVKENAQCIAREFLQSCFNNMSRSDVYEELNAILEFEDVDFANALKEAVSKNFKIVSKIVGISISEHVRRESTNAI